ncbi:MAG: hypothetical protein ACYDB8_00760, partial [Acidiferrobacterales bacterium]
RPMPSLRGRIHWCERVYPVSEWTLANRGWTIHFFKWQLGHCLFDAAPNSFSGGLLGLRGITPIQNLALVAYSLLVRTAKNGAITHAERPDPQSDSHMEEQAGVETVRYESSQQDLSAA